MWKVYLAYGLGVIALVYWTSSQGVVMVNWADLFDDSGGSGYHSYGGGSYHK